MALNCYQGEQGYASHEILMLQQVLSFDLDGDHKTYKYEVCMASLSFLYVARFTTLVSFSVSVSTNNLVINSVDITATCINPFTCAFIDY